MKTIKDTKRVRNKMTPMEKQWLHLRKKLQEYRDETSYQNKVDEVLAMVPKTPEDLAYAVKSASKLYNFISYSVDLGMSK